MLKDNLLLHAVTLSLHDTFLITINLSEFYQTCCEKEFFRLFFPSVSGRNYNIVHN